MRFCLCLVSCLSVCGPGTAAEYWDYADWTVHIEDLDTEEDLRRICTAWTGGDGLPALRLQITNGDVGPPDAYPLPTLEERAPRGHRTQIRPEDAVVFEFDTGTGSEVSVTMALEDGVFEVAQAAPFQRDTLWVLQSMRAGSAMTVYRMSAEAPGRVAVTSVSLSGFTAAFLKMMSRCGHAPGAVME